MYSVTNRKPLSRLIWAAAESCAIFRNEHFTAYRVKVMQSLLIYDHHGLMRSLLINDHHGLMRSLVI